MFLEIFWSVFILFIWFNTDAFVQYSKVFKLGEQFKISDWENYRLTSRVSYPDYLFLKHKSFFTKLISCIPCSLFWIVLIITLIFNSTGLYPVIYILSYIIYKIIDKYV